MVEDFPIWRRLLLTLTYTLLNPLYPSQTPYLTCDSQMDFIGQANPFIHDPDTNSWTPIASMGTAREYLGLTTLNTVSYTHLTLPTILRV